MLHFAQNAVTQIADGKETNYDPALLLEMPDPLAGEPLAERNAAMRQVVDMAEAGYGELSDAARLRYDFWKLFLPQRMEPQTFEYTVKIAKTYRWRLEVQPAGLIYTDISGLYDPMLGKKIEQLWSDFWFYGPCWPLPDAFTRKMLVAAVRNAYLQAGSPSSYKHFTLFDYPDDANLPLQWTNGDEKASDFVLLRSYGIEMGSQNWRDGLVHVQYLSFEQFLHLPQDHQSRLITPFIRGEIAAFLQPYIVPKPTIHERTSGAVLQRSEHYTERIARSKQLFMDNCGLTHRIYMDGEGPNYSATPAEEAAWRQELLEDYARRLCLEEDTSTIVFLARMMKLNGSPDVARLLTEAMQAASPKTKQGLVQALAELFDK